jgi:hypothetical protein
MKCAREMSVASGSMAHGLHALAAAVARAPNEGSLYADIYTAATYSIIPIAIRNQSQMMWQNATHQSVPYGSLAIGQL